jgi:hypothetical protein
VLAQDRHALDRAISRQADAAQEIPAEAPTRGSSAEAQSTKTDLGRRVLCLGHCVLVTRGRRKLLDESLAGNDVVCR